MRRAICICIGAFVAFFGCAVGSFGAGGGEMPPGDAGVDAYYAPFLDAAPRDVAAAPDVGQDVMAGAPPDAAPGAGPQGGPPLTDAAPGSDGSSGTVGLDPKLALPSPFGKPCATIGNVAECPYGQICRIESPYGGRCEGCTKCAGLGSPCAASADCGVLLQCYAGTCTNLCMRNTTWCGRRSACIDVGNPYYGVCL